VHVKSTDAPGADLSPAGADAGNAVADRVGAEQDFINASASLRSSWPALLPGSERVAPFCPPAGLWRTVRLSWSTVVDDANAVPARLTSDDGSLASMVRSPRRSLTSRQRRLPR
jgi:hypothetical protein